MRIQIIESRNRFEYLTTNRKICFESFGEKLFSIFYRRKYLNGFQKKKKNSLEIKLKTVKYTYA